MSTCQRCGVPVTVGKRACPSCGAAVSLSTPVGPLGLTSSFGAEYGSRTVELRRRRKWVLVICTVAAITLLSVAALMMVETGQQRRAEQGQPGTSSPRTIEKDDTRRAETRTPRDRFPKAVGVYSLASVKQSVTEDLRRDSLEAFAASYTAGGGRQVTYVLVSYATAERAKQSLDMKVTAMREGAISRAEVAERMPKKDASGRVVGERVVLSMAVLEQIIWTEGAMLGMVTSRTGQAVEFERLLW